MSAYVARKGTVRIFKVVTTRGARTAAISSDRSQRGRAAGYTAQSGNLLDCIAPAGNGVLQGTQRTAPTLGVSPGRAHGRLGGTPVSRRCRNLAPVTSGNIQQVTQVTMENENDKFATIEQ